VEDAVEQKLAPFTELLTQLARKVEQLSLRDGGMDDNNGPRQVAEAGPSVLCAAKDETSVEFMGTMFCCNFLRKSRLWQIWLARRSTPDVATVYE
jgi:hypothetical protein